MFLILWFASGLFFVFLGIEVTGIFMYLAIFQLGMTLGAMLMLACVEEQFLKRGMNFSSSYEIWDRFVPKWMKS